MDPSGSDLSSPSVVFVIHLELLAMVNLDELLVFQALFEHRDPDQTRDQEHQTHREEQLPQQHLYQNAVCLF